MELLPNVPLPPASNPGMMAMGSAGAMAGAGAYAAHPPLTIVLQNAAGGTTTIQAPPSVENVAIMLQQARSRITASPEYRLLKTALSSAPVTLAVAGLSAAASVAGRVASSAAATTAAVAGLAARSAADSVIPQSMFAASLAAATGYRPSTHAAAAATASAGAAMAMGAAAASIAAAANPQNQQLHQQQQQYTQHQRSLTAPAVQQQQQYQYQQQQQPAPSSLNVAAPGSIGWQANLLATALTGGSMERAIMGGLQLPGSKQGHVPGSATNPPRMTIYRCPQCTQLLHAPADAARNPVFRCTCGCLLTR